MRKIICLIVFVLSLGVMKGYADETVLPNMPGAAPGQEELLDLKVPNMKAELEALSRRVADLERQIRFQDEKVRNMDRMIDDLKRRNLR